MVTTDFFDIESRGTFRKAVQAINPDYQRAIAINDPPPIGPTYDFLSSFGGQVFPYTDGHNSGAVVKYKDLRGLPDVGLIQEAIREPRSEYTAQIERLTRLCAQEIANYCRINFSGRKITYIAQTDETGLIRKTPYFNPQGLNVDIDVSDTIYASFPDWAHPEIQLWPNIRIQVSVSNFDQLIYFDDFDVDLTEPLALMVGYLFDAPDAQAAVYRAGAIINSGAGSFLNRYRPRGL